MTLKIVCWNIKGFSSAKVNHSVTGPDITAVFAGCDIGFILEARAPALIGQLDAATLEGALGIGWRSDAEYCGGLGNEEESVAVVYRTGVSLSGFTALAGTWDGSIRKPVLATVQKGGKTYKIGVWHAPPPGEKDHLRAAAWPQVLSGLGNAGAQIIMGDFNAELTVSRRGNYVCASAGKIYGTTLNNPALVRCRTLGDAITGSAYDRVYTTQAMEKKIQALGLYLSPYPDLNPVPRTAVRNQDKKDPVRAYAMSDHLPVLLVVS